jgi:hypothetical protein
MASRRSRVRIPSAPPFFSPLGLADWLRFPVTYSDFLPRTSIDLQRVKPMKSQKVTIYIRLCGEPRRPFERVKVRNPRQCGARDHYCLRVGGKWEFFAVDDPARTDLNAALRRQFEREQALRLGVGCRRKATAESGRAERGGLGHSHPPCNHEVHRRAARREQSPSAHHQGQADRVGALG